MSTKFSASSFKRYNFFSLLPFPDSKISASTLVEKFVEIFQSLSSVPRVFPLASPNSNLTVVVFRIWSCFCAEKLALHSLRPSFSAPHVICVSTSVSFVSSSNSSLVHTHLGLSSVARACVVGIPSRSRTSFWAKEFRLFFLFRVFHHIFISD